MSTYTVEIQAGNAEGTIWQAMAPAEDVIGTASWTVEDAAHDTIANQNVIDPLDDSGPWRIAVWEGSDADTGSTPAYILDDQQWRDGQADIAERAEDGRVEH